MSKNTVVRGTSPAGQKQGSSKDFSIGDIVTLLGSYNGLKSDGDFRMITKDGLVNLTSGNAYTHTYLVGNIYELVTDAITITPSK